MERTREETGEKVGNEKIGKLREMEGKDEEREGCIAWEAGNGRQREEM